MAVHDMPLKDTWHLVRSTKQNRRRQWATAYEGIERRKSAKPPLTKQEFQKLINEEFDDVARQIGQLKNKGDS